LIYSAGTSVGKFIELNAGFEVGSDASFPAYMEGCFSVSTKLPVHKPNTNSRSRVNR